MSIRFDRPVVDYLVIIVCSLAAALICFKLGDSLAKVSNNDANFLGFTFEAGGALAGFLIIFALSRRVLEGLRRARDMLAIPVSVYVETQTKFDPPASKYRCEATLYNVDTGETRTVPMQPGLENGALRFDLRDVLLAEFVSAMISDDRNQEWYLEDFKPFTQKKAAILLLRGQSNGERTNSGAEA
jgi:hypothetical protein